MWSSSSHTVLIIERIAFLFEELINLAKNSKLITSQIKQNKKFLDFRNRNKNKVNEIFIMQTIL
jgi:hypothetical protein